MTGLVLSLATVGCKREQVREYQAPQEAPPAPAPAAQTGQTLPPGHPDISGGGGNAGLTMPAVPKLVWKSLPEGWVEKAPSAMRAASFEITNSTGVMADVSVIPLPIGGRELDLVNMWRQQVSLPPSSDADADKEAAAVTIGGEKGKLFDMASAQPLQGSADRTRILVAMMQRGQLSWFFKVTGAAEFVEAQKPAFVEFMKDISFDDTATAAPAADMGMGMGGGAMDMSGGSMGTGGSPDLPEWTVPANWKAVPPTSMLLAKFDVTGSSNAKAEMTVSSFGGPAGGLLANVNRWRRQVGLGPVDEAGMDKMISTIDASGGKATLVDVVGTDAKSGAQTRILGAVVPQGDQTWFYKMMGNPAVVEDQKAAFTQFVQTIKYPHAP